MLSLVNTDLWVLLTAPMAFLQFSGRASVSNRAPELKNGSSVGSRTIRVKHALPHTPYQRRPKENQAPKNEENFNKAEHGLEMKRVLKPYSDVLLLP